MLGFLAFLDLVICAIIYKIALYKEAHTRLMVDKISGQVFYVKNVINKNAHKDGSSFLNTEINDNDINELVEERDA